MKGITINAKAIAAGLLEMVETMPDSDSYKTALRFGMLPNPLMQVLDKCLADKARAIVEERIGKRPDDDGTSARECWDYLWTEAEAWRKEFVRECSHNVALAMYGMVDMVV